MSYGSAFVEDGTAGGFQLLYHGSGAVASGFDDVNPRVDDNLRVAVVVWRDESREEGQVDAKWIVGHAAAAGNLLTEVFGCGLGECCELGE